MVLSRTTGWLGPALALCLTMSTGVETISKNFVNSSMPEMRPTFVVNFDMATVICQHSADSTDLHLHEISVLCDGKDDCYQNPAMHDESFPYCERKCNSTCNDRGACLYDGEKPQCYCNSGFSGPTCEIVDKNECQDKPCHWLAHCQNTVGSYECACFPGFHGDGYQCADIDECSMSSYSCPENSVCVNLPGTYFCNCTEGFAPKGLPLEKCADINECEMNLHNCGASQMCQNTVGGFTCVDRCSEGYQYVDGECVDVDECRQDGICDRRAECINTPGGYECKCDAGLTGDGKHCTPITDCSQQEDICDRHAFCIKSLKLCICQTGYVGDGITCNDVNECASMENPCENQEGNRCVNIKGGYICCDKDVDDDRCIRDKGAFCAGGCGLHAVCFNQTCQCMEGFVGNPHTRCIDVNECESNDMCAGVGQWCVNKMGGHICCSSDSKEPECQGVHIFKTNDGEVMLKYNETGDGLFVQHHAGSSARNISGGTFITKQGFLKGEGLFPSVNVNRKNELMCTSYCPGHSECVDGVCRCLKGFGGNPLFGCEDIDECVTNNPCPYDKDTWCVNIIGSYQCCTPESTDTDCIGLEIASGPGGDLRLTGGGAHREAFLAATLNESFSGETLSQSIHEVHNFSAGEVLVVKNKVKTNVFEMKPLEGEVGLEIVADRGDKQKVDVHPILPSKSSSLDLTTSAPVLTVTLPGVISTLGGASAVTTSIPITEIPVHMFTTEAPVLTKNATSATFSHATDSHRIVISGEELAGSTSTVASFTSHETSGEEPKTPFGTGDSTNQPDIRTLARSGSPHEDEDLIAQNTTYSAFTDIIGEVELTAEEKVTPRTDVKFYTTDEGSGNDTAETGTTLSGSSREEEITKLMGTTSGDGKSKPDTDTISFGTPKAEGTKVIAITRTFEEAAQRKAAQSGTTPLGSGEASKEPKIGDSTTEGPARASKGGTGTTEMLPSESTSKKAKLTTGPTTEAGSAQKGTKALSSTSAETSGSTSVGSAKSTSSESAETIAATAQLSTTTGSTTVGTTAEDETLTTLIENSPAAGDTEAKATATSTSGSSEKEKARTSPKATTEESSSSTEPPTAGEKAEAKLEKSTKATPSLEKPSDNEEGLEISPASTGKSTIPEESQKVGPTSVEGESSGEDLKGKGKADKNSIVVNVSTASGALSGSAGTGPLEGAQIVQFEKGEFGSVSSGHVRLPGGLKITDGTVSKAASGTQGSGSSLLEASVTEGPIDGDEVGLEIVHHGGNGTTPPEVGLEIGPVRPRVTLKPGKPDIITDGEPSGSQEIIDGVAPEGTTKAPVSGSSRVSEGSGEITPGGSAAETTLAPTSPVIGALEASGEPSTSSELTTTEQPDLVLSMGTSQKNDSTGITPTGEQAGTTTDTDLVLSTTARGEEASVATEQPDLVLSMGTTLRAETRTSATTKQSESSSGETESTTAGIKGTTGTATTPSTTSTEETSTPENSATSTDVARIDIDDTEGSGIEGDIHPGKEKPTKAMSTIKKGSVSPMTEEPTTINKSTDDQVTATTSVEPASTSTPTSASSSSTASSVNTTPTLNSTVSKESPSLSSTSSLPALTTTSAAPAVTETPEIERKDIVGPGAERAPKDTTGPSTTPEGELAEANVTTPTKRTGFASSTPTSNLPRDPGTHSSTGPPEMTFQQTTAGGAKITSAKTSRASSSTAKPIQLTTGPEALTSPTGGSDASSAVTEAEPGESATATDSTPSFRSSTESSKSSDASTAAESKGSTISSKAISTTLATQAGAIDSSTTFKPSGTSPSVSSTAGKASNGLSTTASSTTDKTHGLSSTTSESSGSLNFTTFESAEESTTSTAEGVRAQPITSSTPSDASSTTERADGSSSPSPGSKEELKSRVSTTPSSASESTSVKPEGSTTPTGPVVTSLTTKSPTKEVERATTVPTSTPIVSGTGQENATASTSEEAVEATTGPETTDLVSLSTDGESESEKASQGGSVTTTSEPSSASSGVTPAAQNQKGVTSNKEPTSEVPMTSATTGKGSTSPALTLSTETSSALPETSATIPSSTESSSGSSTQDETPIRTPARSSKTPIPTETIIKHRTASPLIIPELPEGVEHHEEVEKLPKTKSGELTPSTTEHPTASASIIPELPEGVERHEGAEKLPTAKSSKVTPSTTEHHTASALIIPELPEGVEHHEGTEELPTPKSGHITSGTQSTTSTSIIPDLPEGGERHEGAGKPPIPNFQKLTPSITPPTDSATVTLDLLEGVDRHGGVGKLPTPRSDRTTPESSTTEPINLTTNDDITDEILSSTPKQNRATVTKEADESSQEQTSEVSTTKDTFILTTPTTKPATQLGPSNNTKCTSGDQCGSDAYCERRTGACRCYPGFEGAPPLNPCHDVDECAAGLHKCDDSARCHNYVGGYACFCPMGFRKDDNGKCVDINECTESNGACCSTNATCINKLGSYGCVCNEGFFGDGYKCMPLEKRGCTEAEWAVANCGKNHMCLVDAKGIKDCSVCKMGFEMVDGECVDINECTEPGLNMCDKNAVCNNLMGTYACQCKKGFRGDGYMCEDEDECLMMPCHPQAECKNTPGSYECRCPLGFEGDGVKSCVNPTEQSCLEMEKFCGRTNHTACLSVRVFDGSLTSICECEPNYRFNMATRQCEDIDECAENRHNCDPASSVCVNEDGGFRCECLEGYEGTGGVCVDVNECERGIAGCHSMAMCINQPGSCGCKCIHGFTGDGTQCNAMGREIENACTPEWQRLCKLENKTCHVDEEEVPQCGSCLEGYQPMNGTCLPVQKGGNCADPAKNTCDNNAECIDVHPGRHFCTCKIGYIGDGLRCDDIDECSLPGVCDPYATCRNFAGSFECICGEGYTGNGFQCEPITNGTESPNCHLDTRLCHSNANCMADGKCKCRPGFEGDGIENCTQIATSSFPSIGKSTTPNTITSAISASESSTTPKGSDVGTGENEVTGLTSGESRSVATTTPAESFAATSRHGKDGTGTSLITEFQSSSTSEPTSVTSPHSHLESTLSTTLDSSSNLTTETTLIHEKSTTHAAEITGTDRVVTILKSGVNVTEDNTTDTTSKQLHSTLSVNTNQPKDNLTIYTTERPHITPILIEVTNSLVVLQPGTLRPDKVITGVPFEHEIPNGKLGVVTSDVLHRGTTPPTLEPPSRVTGSSADFPEDLGLTGRGSIVQVTDIVSKNETLAPKNETPVSPIRGSIVTSLPVTLSSTSTSPSIVTASPNSVDFTVDQSSETFTSLSTPSAETGTPAENEITSSSESDHASDEVTTEGAKVITLPSTDTTDSSVESTLSEISKDSSTQFTTSNKLSASLETLKAFGSTTKAPRGSVLQPSIQTSNKTTEEVLESTLPDRTSPTPKPTDAKKTTVSSAKKNFTYGTTGEGIEHEKTDAFFLSTATTAFIPPEEASGSEMPSKTTAESTLTSEKSYSSMTSSYRSSSSGKFTEGEQERFSLTPRISSQDFGEESSGEPALNSTGNRETLTTTDSSADFSSEEFVGNGTTIHPYDGKVTATGITREVNVSKEMVGGGRISANGTTESAGSAILGSTEPSTSRKFTASAKPKPAFATSAPTKSTKQSEPSSRRPLITFNPAPEGLRSTDEPSFTITEDTAYPKGKGATRSSMENFPFSTIISTTISATHDTTSAEDTEILSTPEETGADAASTAETSSSQGHTSSPTSSDVTSVTAKPWTPSTTQASKTFKPSTSSSKVTEEATQGSMTTEEGTGSKPSSSVTSDSATERPKATKPWIITGTPISEEVLSSDRPRPSHATKPWIITGVPTSEEFLSTDTPSSKKSGTRVELVTASIEGSGTSDSSWSKRPGFARKPYTSGSEESTTSTLTTTFEASGSLPWNEEMTTVSSWEETLTSAQNLTTSAEVTDLNGRRVTIGSANFTEAGKENLEGITEVFSRTGSTARTQPKKQTEDSIIAVSSQHLTTDKEHITHSAATNESSSEADFTSHTGSTTPTSDIHISSDRHQITDHFEQYASTITAITNGVTQDINVVTLSTVEGTSSSTTTEPTAELTQRADTLSTTEGELSSTGTTLLPQPTSSFNVSSVTSTAIPSESSSVEGKSSTTMSSSSGTSFTTVSPTKSSTVGGKSDTTPLTASSTSTSGISLLHTKTAGPEGTGTTTGEASTVAPASEIITPTQPSGTEEAEGSSPKTASEFGATSTSSAGVTTFSTGSAEVTGVTLVPGASRTNSTSTPSLEIIPISTTGSSARTTTIGPISLNLTTIISSSKVGTSTSPTSESGVTGTTLEGTGVTGPSSHSKVSSRTGNSEETTNTPSGVTLPASSSILPSTPEGADVTGPLSKATVTSETGSSEKTSTTPSGMTDTNGSSKSAQTSEGRDNTRPFSKVTITSVKDSSKEISTTPPGIIDTAESTTSAQTPEGTEVIGSSAITSRTGSSEETSSTPSGGNDTTSYRTSEYTLEGAKLTSSSTVTLRAGSSEVTSSKAKGVTATASISTLAQTSTGTSSPEFRVPSITHSAEAITTTRETIYTTDLSPGSSITAESVRSTGATSTPGTLEVGTPLSHRVTDGTSEEVHSTTDADTSKTGTTVDPTASEVTVTPGAESATTGADVGERTGRTQESTEIFGPLPSRLTISSGSFESTDVTSARSRSTSTILATETTSPSTAIITTLVVESATSAIISATDKTTTSPGAKDASGSSLSTTEVGFTTSTNPGEKGFSTTETGAEDKSTTSSPEVTFSAGTVSGQKGTSVTSAGMGSIRPSPESAVSGTFTSEKRTTSASVSLGTDGTSGTVSSESSTMSTPFSRFAVTGHSTTEEGSAPSAVSTAGTSTTSIQTPEVTYSRSSFEGSSSPLSEATLRGKPVSTSGTEVTVFPSTGARVKVTLTEGSESGTTPFTKEALSSGAEGSGETIITTSESTETTARATGPTPSTPEETTKLPKIPVASSSTMITQSSETTDTDRTSPAPDSATTSSSITLTSRKSETPSTVTLSLSSATTPPFHGKQTETSTDSSTAPSTTTTLHESFTSTAQSSPEFSTTFLLSKTFERAKTTENPNIPEEIPDVTEGLKVTSEFETEKHPSSTSTTTATGIAVEIVVPDDMDNLTTIESFREKTKINSSSSLIGGIGTTSSSSSSINSSFFTEKLEPIEVTTESLNLPASVQNLSTQTGSISSSSNSEEPKDGSMSTKASRIPIEDRGATPTTSVTKQGTFSLAETSTGTEDLTETTSALEVSPDAPISKVASDKTIVPEQTTPAFTDPSEPSVSPESTDSEGFSFTSKLGVEAATAINVQITTITSNIKAIDRTTTTPTLPKADPAVIITQKSLPPHEADLTTEKLQSFPTTVSTTDENTDLSSTVSASSTPKMEQGFTAQETTVMSSTLRTVTSSPAEAQTWSSAASTAVDKAKTNGRVISHTPTSNFSTMETTIPAALSIHLRTTPEQENAPESASVTSTDGLKSSGATPEGAAGSTVTGASEFTNASETLFRTALTSSPIATDINLTELPTTSEGEASTKTELVIEFPITGTSGSPKAEDSTKKISGDIRSISMPELTLTTVVEQITPTTFEVDATQGFDGTSATGLEARTRKTSEPTATSTGRVDTSSHSSLNLATKTSNSIEFTLEYEDEKSSSTTALPTGSGTAETTKSASEPTSDSSDRTENGSTVRSAGTSTSLAIAITTQRPHDPFTLRIEEKESTSGSSKGLAESRVTASTQQLTESTPSTADKRSMVASSESGRAAIKISTTYLPSGTTTLSFKKVERMSSPKPIPTSATEIPPSSSEPTSAKFTNQKPFETTTVISDEERTEPTSTESPTGPKEIATTQRPTEFSTLGLRESMSSPKAVTTSSKTLEVTGRFSDSTSETPEKQENSPETVTTLVFDTTRWSTKPPPLDSRLESTSVLSTTSSEIESMGTTTQSPSQSTVDGSEETIASSIVISITTQTLPLRTSISGTTEGEITPNPTASSSEFVTTEVRQTSSQPRTNSEEQEVSTRISSTTTREVATRQGFSELTPSPRATSATSATITTTHSSKPTSTISESEREEVKVIHFTTAEKLMPTSNALLTKSSTTKSSRSTFQPISATKQEEGTRTTVTTGEAETILEALVRPTLASNEKERKSPSAFFTSSTTTESTHSPLELVSTEREKGTDTPTSSGTMQESSEGPTLTPSKKERLTSPITLPKPSPIMEMTTETTGLTSTIWQKDDRKTTASAGESGSTQEISEHSTRISNEEKRTLSPALPTLSPTIETTHRGPMPFLTTHEQKKSTETSAITQETSELPTASSDKEGTLSSKLPTATTHTPFKPISIAEQDGSTKTSAIGGPETTRKTSELPNASVTAVPTASSTMETHVFFEPVSMTEQDESTKTSATTGEQKTTQTSKLPTASSDTEGRLSSSAIPTASPPVKTHISLEPISVAEQDGSMTSATTGKPETTQGTSERSTLASSEEEHTLSQSSPSLSSTRPVETTHRISHPISTTHEPEESTKTLATTKEPEAAQEIELSTLASSEKERLSSPAALLTALKKMEKTRQIPTEPSSTTREQEGKKSSTSVGEPETTQESSERPTQSTSVELKSPTIPTSSLTTKTTHRTSAPLPTTHEEEGTKTSAATREQETTQSTLERSIQAKSEKERLSSPTALPTVLPKIRMSTQISTEHSSTTRQDGKKSSSSAGKPQTTQGTSERPTIALREMEHTPPPSALPRASPTVATTTQSSFEHSLTTSRDQKKGMKPSTEAKVRETTQETLRLLTETLEQLSTPTPSATSTSSEPEVARRTESTLVNIEKGETVSSGSRRPSGTSTTQWPRDPLTLGSKEKEPILSFSAPTESHVMKTTQRPAELTPFTKVESVLSFSKPPGVLTEISITPSPIKSTISDPSRLAHMTTSNTTSTSRITEVLHSATTTASLGEELVTNSQTPAAGKNTQRLTELPTTRMETTQGFLELDLMKTTQEHDRFTERLREESTPIPTVLLTGGLHRLETTQEPSEPLTESSGDTLNPQSGVNSVSPDESTRTELDKGLTESSAASTEEAEKTTQTPEVPLTVEIDLGTTPGETKKRSTSTPRQGKRFS